MQLILRRTGLSRPVYRDRLDYTVIEDGREIGRMYEDWHAHDDLRWFWSITKIIQMPSGQSFVSSARAATLEMAKGQFMANWLKCRRFAR